MERCSYYIIKKNLCMTIILCMTLVHIAHSQDPVFSQPYMSPVYLNPAATGSGDHDLRISAAVRRQWWTVPSSFTYGTFSLDKFIPQLQSGVGLLVTSSSEGYLKKDGVYLSYAYTFCPGVNTQLDDLLPKWFLTGAMQFGAAERHVNYKDLLFADQIDVNGITGGATGADLPVFNNRLYPDMGAGLIFNYRFSDLSRILVGASARHVNRPDESLTATNSIPRSILPVLWSANFLYTNSSDEHWTYSVAGNFSKQQQNHFTQLGIEVTQNDYDISLAAWYRGGATLKDPDAITVSLIFNLSGKNNPTSNVRVGLSHDSPIGNKKYSYNGGSSEFGFLWDKQTYQTNNQDQCKPVINPGLACPHGFR